MVKVLVITGASSGIGLATASLFSRKGWHVYNLSRHAAPDSLPSVVHVPCDVTSEQACGDAVAAVLKLEDHVDVLISNAGFGISGPIEFTETQDAKRLFDVNFFGAHNIAKAVLPVMRAQGRGSIIFTSSMGAPLALPYQAFYSASKSAVSAMALALANEVREFGIKVACVLPGDVKTGFTAAREKSIVGVDVYTHAEHAVAIMEHDEQHGMSPDSIARMFYSVATSHCPRPLNVPGLQYKLFNLLDSILPKRLVNWIVGKIYC